MQASPNLHGGVTRTDDALAFAPSSNHGNVFPKDSVETFYNAVIEANQA